MLSLSNNWLIAGMDQILHENRKSGLLLLRRWIAHYRVELRPFSFDDSEAPTRLREAVLKDGAGRDAVARLAYKLWNERGRPLGSPEKDWFRAEQRIRRLSSSENLRFSDVA